MNWGSQLSGQPLLEWTTSWLMGPAALPTTALVGAGELLGMCIIPVVLLSSLWWDLDCFTVGLKLDCWEGGPQLSILQWHSRAQSFWNGNWYLFINVLLVNIPSSCWYLSVVCWSRALNLSCWFSCTLSSGWLHLHWVTSGLVLLFLVDVSCLSWDSWVPYEEPHFPHCI